MFKKKVFLISMVKNEADIIESFVRYHLNIFDGIVILENKSTDNTWNILKQIKSEGLPLFIIKDENLEFIKGKKTTKLLYDTLQKYHPDIIFLLDADEFLVASNNKDHPRKVIENDIALNKVYFIKRNNYFPTKSDNLNKLFIPERIIYKSNDDILPKVVFPRGILRNYPMNVGQGNHEILSGGKPINKETLRNIKIAHFPMRSIEHFKSKAVLGWIANLSRHDRGSGDSHHWKKWFNQIRENPDITLNDIIPNEPLNPTAINLSFCKKLDIKYTKKNEVNFMKNLLNYCELLALEQAKLRVELLNKKI